ncbi:MAG: hypothetical protein AAF226_15755, partial [Verrucomicrobiota bacterium]
MAKMVLILLGVIILGLGFEGNGQDKVKEPVLLKVEYQDNKIYHREFSNTQEVRFDGVSSLAGAQIRKVTEIENEFHLKPRPNDKKEVLVYTLSSDQFTLRNGKEIPSKNGNF